MGHCVRLLVPTDNEAELGPIIGRIVGRWGGVTMSDASGWWTDANSKPVKDKLTILECFTSSWFHPETREWWFDLADVVRKEWNQDCVMLTVHHADGWLVEGLNPDDRKRVGL